MTKVSVIVPVYNVEKFLKRCLDSIINQTLKDIEIICIYYNSNDKTLEILEQIASKDSRITVIMQRTKGQAGARNEGTDIATGEYIGFVDSDDWIDLDFYEKLYNSAKKYDADIAVGSIIRLHKYNKKYHLKIEDEVVTEDTNKKFELCDVPEKSYIWNKIYKTEKLKEFNLKFEEGILFEDVIYTPQVLYNLKKLVTVAGVNYYYWRRFVSSVTRKDEKAKRDSIYAHNKAKEFFKEHNIDVSKQEVITKRYKLFGLTIFKTKTKGDTTIYSFLNFIKIKCPRKAAM